MSHSFLCYGDVEKRFHDTDLEVCVCLIWHFLDNVKDKLDEEELRLIEVWYFHVRNTAPGLLDFGLENFKNADKLKFLLNFMRERVSCFEMNVPKKILNEACGHGREVFFSDYPKNDVLSALSSLIELVRNGS